MVTAEKPTRIQKVRREEILEAALEEFSRNGFKGASINKIAARAGMSTPRLLYHFEGKEALYRALLKSTLLRWLGPLELLKDAGDPVEEVCAYIRRKLEMSRAYPRESRLFAQEILLGVPLGKQEVFAPLREIFDAKIALLQRWMDEGRITRVDPHHLMYSIWATTQHYADFAPQIAELSPQKMPVLFEAAEAFLLPMYRRTLEVR
ncbi:MAG: TetR family transcriptional regulator C-terminal domain-containing protein [Pseudomonadota bacterium]